MAKRVRLSSDDITYATLPGSSGEITNEAGSLPDTIFGQDFDSNFPGLIGWQVQGNGIFKGFAGYTVALKQGGTPIATAAEAMALVSGKTYETTDSVKAIMDRTSPPVIKDNAIIVAAADILEIDYLFGRVTFAASYTPTTPITWDGDYIPTAAIAGAKEFTLTQTANAIDETTIVEAKANSGHRIFDYGLKTVSLDMTGVYAVSNGNLASLKARSEVIVEINPDDSGLAVARGFFRFSTQSQSGDVGALEEESVSLILSVPDEDLLARPFGWLIDGTSTMATALQTAITGWQDSAPIFVEYLPDGVVGVTGEGIVTDISLTGGLESMNDFTVNLQGTDQLTTV